MSTRAIFLVAITGLVAATAAWGEETTASVRDVTAVQDGHGSARVFFRLTPMPFSQRTLVERAVLTVPYTGSGEDRPIELRVCPVTRAWAGIPAWDTPCDRRLGARADIDLRSAGVVVLDLTGALKASVEDGAFADGFVLFARTPSGGLPGGDLARFGNLSAARVHVVMTTLPSGWPPERREAMRRNSSAGADGEH